MKPKGDFDFTAETRKLSLPVLVLYGKDDPFGMGMAKAVVSAWSRAAVKLVLLDECGHYWQECPGAFYPQVQEFLNENINSMEDRE